MHSIDYQWKKIVYFSTRPFPIGYKMIFHFCVMKNSSKISYRRKRKEMMVSGPPQKVMWIVLLDYLFRVILYISLLYFLAHNPTNCLLQAIKYLQNITR